MGFIYKITNKVNGKCYIGKTNKDVQVRYKQHLNDASKDRCKNRPLYRAINKYGKDNFNVEIIEVCTNTEDREIYWIQYYKSYGKNGYNATKGGDGKSYIDYTQIENEYNLNQHTMSVKEIASKLGVDYSLCCKYLASLGYNTKESSIALTRKSVLLVETNQIFESILEAGKYIKSKTNSDSSANHIASKISLVCRGIRKSAFKFTWEFVK